MRRTSHSLAIDAAALLDEPDAEAESLARVRSGDEGALKAIFLRYYAMLVSHAERFLDRADAEEAVQEVFIAFWNNRQTWTAKLGLRPSLFVAVRYRALQAIAKRHRRRRRELNYVGESQLFTAEARVGSASEPLLSAVIAATCAEAIQALPNRQRLVVMLRWSYRWSNVEIAHLLNVTPETVDTWLALALQALDTALRTSVAAWRAGSDATTSDPATPDT